MNIDGAVKLSARRELAAIEDPEARKDAYERRVAQGYESAKSRKLRRQIRNRPSRHPSLHHKRHEKPPPNPASHQKEAPLRRYVVTEGETPSLRGERSLIFH